LADGVQATAVSLAASFAILFAVTMLTPAEGIDEDVVAVMDA
jgi:hypothetical protein